ncbi:asparagine synthase-related protein [Haloarchaeobius amylolyticus]|uniref:asparagine synthase-related protein n=1 Tax=Haloarchaeobius amylolyticus TaxID=1198296 RepID=UPI002271F997|nr:asparagine synthase-related protein [Haloarchaeobius amylolyticus]
MVGLAGVVGGGRLPEAMAAWPAYRDAEATFRHEDDLVDLTLRSHPLLAGDQPAVVDDGGGLLWVWGEVFGHGPPDDYEPRPGEPGDSAAYCADLYERHGLDFAAGLNGHFAIVLYDREAETVSFVTDRWSTRPVYHTTVEDGVAVASNPQALVTHPDVPAAFEEDYLHEYLALRRVFGVENPLEGVREFPPAAVTTVDLADGSVSSETYWRPTYRPEDRPFSWFVDRLAALFEGIFEEWTTPDRTYGTLLSGGGDSRFVQAAIDQQVVSFHNADWLSREAKVARQVAHAAGDEFRLLERHDDHETRTLESFKPLSPYSGWFDQAYFTEFEAEMRDAVDVLVPGLFADLLFDGSPLATRTLSLGDIGTVDLPVQTPMETVDDYLDEQLAEAQPVPYFSADRSLREVLRDNIDRRPDGTVVSHGVEYASFTDFVMYSDYHPFGADTEAIFPRSLQQIRPYRLPFLDNRVVDLHSRIPRRYFLRRNVVNAALDRLSPELAAIPHARTGVSMKRSFPAEFLGANLTGFYRKHIDEAPTPAEHLDHKPWPNRRELLRVDPFAIDTIRANEDLLDALPGFDYDAAVETHEAHRDGASFHQALYSLLTVLETPATALVVDADEDVAAVAADDSGRLVPDPAGPGGGDQ